VVAWCVRAAGQPSWAGPCAGWLSRPEQGAKRAGASGQHGPCDARPVNGPRKAGRDGQLGWAEGFRLG
jgi:hypothetical protein